MAEIRKFLDPSGLSLLWDKVKDELDKKADETSLPTKVSELQNDAGYLTQETDPTVPSWAKAQVKPSYTAQEVGALPDNTFIPSNVSDLTNDTGFITSAALPTNVSDLTNDVGYLTQETDPTVPAWAKAINKPSYTAQEVGALPSNTFIPSKVSDLVDDSGHYTKPVTGIPATDLEETYLTQHQDISMKANNADLATVATSGEYNDLLHTPTNVSAFTNDAGYLIQHQDISGKADKTLFANEYEDLTYPVQRFTLCFHNGELYYAKNIIEQQEAWDSTHWIKLDGINGLYVNEQLNFEQMNQKLRKKYEKPVTGIPASDLEETYLTSFTETDPTVPNWAKAAQKPTYTAQEVGALPDNTYIPTKVSDLDNDSGYLTQHQDISGKANSADLAAVATSGAYSDLSGTPTNISSFTNDAGYLTSESDPTVPSWAKAINKPTYTASEVGAPTVSEMNTAISNAIGNVHQFGIEVVQELPTIGIKEHTVYFVPKTGETNDVYDEYIRVNNAWEMIGNTQIDLSNYATKSEIPNVPVTDVQINDSSILDNGIANIPKGTASTFGVLAVGNGLRVSATDGKIITNYSGSAKVKAGTEVYQPIVPYIQHESVFFGLSKAAGVDLANETVTVGTYPANAKTAIKTMLSIAEPSTIIDDTATNGETAKVWSADKTYDELALKQDKTFIVNLTKEGNTPVMDKTRTEITEAIDAGKEVICIADRMSSFTAKNDHFFPLRLFSYHVTNDEVDVFQFQNSFITTINNSTYFVKSTATYNGSTVSWGDQFTLIPTKVSELTNDSDFYTKPSGGIPAADLASGVIPNVPVQDVQINETSVINNGVANIPVASSSTLGVMKVDNEGTYGVILDSNELKISPASEADVKSGVSVYKPIVPSNQHKVVFYGLCKAAGVDMSSSDNTVGTYTSAAATAIKTMLQVQEGLKVVRLI